MDRGARGLDKRGLPMPEYPRASREAREQGTVKLAVMLRGDFSVESVSVVSTSGHPRLDDAAIAALQGATFPREVVRGRGVGEPIVVPYTFRLE